MPGQPFDLIGGFYQDDSLPWSAQDTVNWIPEAAEAQGTRTPSILRNAPGLRPYIQVGEGPIRGMRNVEGKLLVVSGNELYQISNTGVAIPRGTIPGTGLVSMSHNQRQGTNQCLIVNGSAGYVYDTSALTLTKITDAGYPGAFVVDFVDGYLAQVEPLRRYWFHSALRDALEYSTLDRYEAEGQPDAIVTLLVDHREVWVFGERTTEPYVNTGNLTNTFQRASNTVIEQGCAAKFSPAKLDNSIFWLDELGIVRRADGYTPVRVSTGPIERAIADLDWKRAFGFTMTDRGHAIYYLTFPDGKTWGYDLTTGLWHRRESYGLDRWRVNCVAQWNGDWLAGDYQQGLLYVIDWDYPFEGTDPVVRERRTGVLHADQNRVAVPYAELIIDNGRGPVLTDAAPVQPTGPTITGNAPNGNPGDAYSFAYTLGGGTPPYVVSLRSGTLPTGVTLSSAGVLSGTLDALGSFSFVVRNTDANGLYADLSDTINVAAVSDWILTGNFGAPSNDIATVASGDFTAPTLIASSLGIALDKVLATETRAFVWQAGVTGNAISTDAGATFGAPTGFTNAGRDGCVSADEFFVPALSTLNRSPSAAAFTSESLVCNAIAVMPTLAYAYGGYNFNYESTDGGATWNNNPASIDPVYSTTGEDKFGTDGDVIFTAAFSGSTAGVFGTTTDGINWTATALPAARAATNCIAVLYTGLGYCVLCANGDIFYKLDAGSWTLSAFNADDLNGAACDGVRIIAVGPSGYVIESLDGGVTWAAVPNDFAGLSITAIDNLGAKPTR